MTSRPKDNDVTLRDEFSLIADFFAPLTENAPGAFQLRDDAAILTPTDGYNLVITKDMLVAGVHFFADDPADLIAQKALRVNLSDLAAKGARPIAYSLACAWPEETMDEWIKTFVTGLATDQKTFDVVLIGGDTVRTPGPLTISVTAYGEVPYGKIITRDGAQVDDLVCVSGAIGDAGLGLKSLQEKLADMSDKDATYLRHRYHCPEPRLALGQALQSGATACLDVSDGLVADAGHLADASGVALEIELSQIPISEAAQRTECDPVDLITSGDDYELLFTCASSKHDALKTLAKQLHLPLTIIGCVVDGAGVSVIDDKGGVVDIKKGGYTHS